MITVANSFIATSESITSTGAKVAFIDIDPKTYNMDPNKLEDYLKKCFKLQKSSLKPRPKAVIPVHLYGQPADMDPIMELARKI